MNAISLVTLGYICPGMQQAVANSGVVPPQEGQQLLVQALSLPLPSSMTNINGVHQSDVIIMSAISAGIADLRANPWLLDYVFASLAKDSLTAERYGLKEIDQAKKWFLKTNIPVVMAGRLDSPSFPVVSIALQESAEVEDTLGDVHYQPSEDTESDWPVLAGPMRPEAYNAGSGIMKLPASVLGNIILTTGMSILDVVGRVHSILEVLDSDTIAIKAGTVADFSRLILKAEKPHFVTALESSGFRETYAIGCHVTGEPVHLTYLHSIVTFLLLRYKEALLEARGFERSVITSREFDRNENFDVEVVYSRFMTITGFVRQSWPKAVGSRIYGLTGSLQVGLEGTGGPGVTGTGSEATGDESWLADRDMVSGEVEE